MCKMLRPKSPHVHCDGTYLNLVIEIYVVFCTNLNFPVNIKAIKIINVLLSFHLSYKWYSRDFILLELGIVSKLK